MELKCYIKHKMKQPRTAWNKGLKENPEVTARRSLTMKRWWSDPENRKLQSEAHKHMQDENHNSWKGDNVGYHQLHKWIRGKLGTPRFCKHCLSTDKKRYEWANISGEYKRELSDWIRLCKPCHVAYDIEKGRWGNATKKFNLTRSQ